MADFRLGRLKFNWRGDWVVNTAYVIDDIVKFGANTYVCISNHTSVSNQTFWYSNDASKWSLHTEGIYNKGNWAASTFYKLNDIVKYGNILYRTIVPHTSAATFVEANFASYLDGLRFEDTWNATSEFQPGDIVTHGGYSYVSKSINTNKAPNLNLITDWEILTTGFKVVGTWDVGTNYKPGDVVLLGGNSYVANITNSGTLPSSSPTTWSFIVGGFTWKGTWNSGTLYQPGDAISRNSNSYINVATSTNDPPELDTTGTYWNSLAQGAQTNVLTSAGDTVYQSGSGPARLPIGTVGQTLTVSSAGYPEWKDNNKTDPVYYVTTNGSDLNDGENITGAWASLRHACDNITGPATIYVKAGTYFETLPIIIPDNVSIVGDNIRTSVIKPKTGNSSTVRLTLGTTPAAQYRVLGDVISAGGGVAKTAMILDVEAGGAQIIIKPLTGGAWTTSDTYETGVVDTTITAVEPITNENSTMFFMSNKTMLKDLVMDGMNGFVPSTTDPKDMNTATIKGVFLRLYPNSPTTKSPYISQCSAFSNTGVGAIVDGDVHAKWDGTATKSNKSMLFDSFTQIHEQGGVGFWITNNGNSEIVSSFTYYAHISYAATRGGAIRSLAGNSSWGTYAIVSSGFNTNEATLDGQIDGKELNYITASLVGNFDTDERITGLTSGAIGEIVSWQASNQKILYRPLKGTFAQNEGIIGQTTSATATLVNNATANQGQSGFTLSIKGLGAAPKAGGSIEFITGPGGLGEEPFTFVVANSSYKAPIGRGTISITRGLLGSTAASHDGLSSLTRYQTGTTTTLTAAINSASESTIFVTSITGITVGGFIIVNNEMMKVDSFPTATSIVVLRGQEGTTAAVHASGATARAIQIKVPNQTTTLGDMTPTSSTIRVVSSNGVLVTDFVKLDNEFMQVTNVATDTTGSVLVVLTQTKPTPTFDTQSFKIRYLYSQVRLTGHDFLNIGTGGKTTTNFPGLPLVAAAQGNEVTEQFPGRVFFVSTDQDGNFTVGRYFKVNQATGSTTLNASSFDLSGLSSLRLGSIGAQLGESISEFSSDTTLSANSNTKVPTQKAVKTYIDKKTKTKGFTFWAGGA